MASLLPGGGSHVLGSYRPCQWFTAGGPDPLLELPRIEEVGVVGVLAGPRGEVGAAFLVRSLDARVGADELLARRRPETRGPWAAPPRDPSGFEVVERLPGDATTDFAAPGKALLADDGPVDASELRRLERGEPFTPSDVEPEDVDWINDATRPLIHAIPPGEAARLAVAIAEETDAAVASLPPGRVWPNDPESPINALRATHRGEHLDEIEAALR